MCKYASRYIHLVAASTLLATSPLASTDWWVATGGNGDGSIASPFGQVQDGIDAALPGDVVRIAPGTYGETIVTARDGMPESPIIIRSEPGAVVVITTSGRVLNVLHSYLVFEGLVLDGQYGDRDAVQVSSEGDFLVLRGVEVRRSGRDCVDMVAPQNVLIENSLIHRCLNPANGGTDAHGVVAGPAIGLTLRGTEIHTFSGDAVQLDPGRSSPGWDSLTIEGCHLWLAPLATAENGFAAGVVPGENAVDTKTWTDAPHRAKLVVRDTVAHGFRDNISNMAAFNLKEKIDALIDGVTVFDSEIAFRLRGPTSRPGAWVAVHNAVVFDVDKAVRYEDDIENLRIRNSTLGAGVARPFQAASAANSVLEVRNLLVLADTLPTEAADPSNRLATATDFVDVVTHDYQLTAGSAPIDSGVDLAEVTVDRYGIRRPQGEAYDVGAHEHCVGCPLFADGFESGDLAAWSSSVGGRHAP